MLHTQTSVSALYQELAQPGPRLLPNAYGQCTSPGFAMSDAGNVYRTSCSMDRTNVPYRGCLRLSLVSPSILTFTSFKIFTTLS
ncbi:hypothetical protein ElyMa_001298400 [Elysia marginata]|uniref:Uncharacterized protein n=1 Tax=Elysia marginata TaxID=1093978 RepID=A0AAV4IJK6_9GAST|nr:hypothetical protein ElyMa_001298400 [Elysia marginata]